MALPTAAEVKARLKVPTAAESLQPYLDAAKAKIVHYLGRAIDVDTFEVSRPTWPKSRSLRGPQDAIVDTESSTTTVAALNTLDGYLLYIEPVISQAIYDVCADLYHNRNPLEQSLSSTGVSRTLFDRALPLRVQADLRPWRV